MVILRKPEHFWPALWIGVVLLLVAVLAAEFEFGRVRVGEGPRAPARIVEAKLLPSFSLPPETQSARDTVERPLFVPTRRPSPPATVAAATSMRKGQFVLTGVTVTRDASFAFLKEVANGKTQSVRKGSQVNGISVDTVDPRRVVLRQGEETEELALVVQVPARMAAAPAPSAGVPPAPGAPQQRGVPAAPGMPGTGTPVAPPGAGGMPGLPNPSAAAQPRAPMVVGDAPAASAPAQPPGAAPATGRRRPWINSQ